MLSDNQFNQLVQRISKEIYDKKEALVKKYLGIIANQKEFDAEAEQEKRFPRLICTVDSSDQSEHWYWNDGTEDGLHIISFYPAHSSSLNEISTTIAFTYSTGRTKIKIHH